MWLNSKSQKRANEGQCEAKGDSLLLSWTKDVAYNTEPEFRLWMEALWNYDWTSEDAFTGAKLDIMGLVPTIKLYLLYTAQIDFIHYCTATQVKMEKKVSS